MGKDPALWTTMAAVAEEVVLAGLVAPGEPEPPSARDVATDDADRDEAEPDDRDALLARALDAESWRLVTDRRDEVANRARGAEKKSLVATAADMILTGWNRIAAVQKDHARKARERAA